MCRRNETGEQLTCNLLLSIKCCSHYNINEKKLIHSGAEWNKLPRNLDPYKISPIWLHVNSIPQPNEWPRGGYKCISNKLSCNRGTLKYIDVRTCD